MAKQQFVVEITLASDSLSPTYPGEVDLTTLLFTDGAGFTTKPTDTPANTWVAPDLLDPGNIRRSIFKNGRIFGAIEASYGAIEIDNSAGQWDYLMTYGVSGHPVRILYGPVGAAYPSGYEIVLIVEGRQFTSTFSKLSFNVRDKMWMLDKPIEVGTFEGTGGIEGGAEMKGKPKQEIVGFAGYTPATLVSYESQLYQVHTQGKYWPVGIWIWYTPPPATVVYEGIIAIPRHGGYTPSDLEGFLAMSPDPGTIAWWNGGNGNDSGPFYFRLGSVPTYDIRVHFPGDVDRNTKYTLEHFAARAGIVGYSGTSLGAGSRYLLDGQETYLEFMNDACIYQNAYFGFSRLAQYMQGKFTTPANSVFEFTQHNAKDYNREPPPGFPAPAYKVVCKFGECWPVKIPAAAYGA